MVKVRNKTGSFEQAAREGRRRAPAKSRVHTENVSELDRRSRILSEATKLFLINGYAETTVRLISDEAGILSGSIYHYFSSKSEIFDEVIRHYISERRDIVVSQSRAGSGFLETVSNMATHQLTHVMSNKVVSGLMLNEARMLSASDRYAFVMEAEVDIFNTWRAVVKNAVQEGRLHSEVDCCLMASTIMVIIDNATRLIVESERVEDFQTCGSEDHIIDQVSAMIFGMISPWAK